jgi:hypothetical protein
MRIRSAAASVASHVTGKTIIPEEHQNSGICLHVNKPLRLHLLINCTTTTMPKDTIYDPTDKGTLRPNSPPLRTKGDVFIPMNLPNFG